MPTAQEEVVRLARKAWESNPTNKTIFSILGSMNETYVELIGLRDSISSRVESENPWLSSWDLDQWDWYMRMIDYEMSTWNYTEGYISDEEFKESVLRPLLYGGGKSSEDPWGDVKFPDVSEGVRLSNQLNALDAWDFKPGTALSKILSEKLQAVAEWAMGSLRPVIDAEVERLAVIGREKLDEYVKENKPKLMAEAEQRAKKGARNVVVPALLGMALLAGIMVKGK